MDLVTGAMGNLAPKLLQLLQAEYKLQKGVRKKIQFLSDELETINAALRKVAAMPPDQLDEQVKIWAGQVREASYDMEDILDTFLVRVEGCPKESAVKRMSKLFTRAKVRHNIESAIEDIKNQLQLVAERRTRYRLPGFKISVK
jgi:disease resistance protein RPM1